MSERRWLQRSAAAVLMSGQLVGCTSWHPETLSPAVVIADKQPNAMRVEYGESHHEVLYQPRVLGDSLVGWREWSDKPSERAVPSVEIRRRNRSGRQFALQGSTLTVGAFPPFGATGWKQTVIDLGLGITFH